MKILITGKHGQVGHELMRSLAPLGDLVGVDMEECDLAKPAAIERLLAHVKPDLIVNPAAYTAVDKAESDANLAHAVNAAAPEVLAKYAASKNIPIIHYSTDYVFDGAKDGLYVETDKANPKSVYGKTKWLGEAAVRNNAPKHVILRTSWAFGVHGNNFLKTILKLAQERDKLSIVADHFGAPTSAAMLADATAVIAKQLFEPGAATKYGTYNLVCDGETSWYGYAQWVLARACEMGVKLKIKSDAINPVSSKEYYMNAPRPKNCRLDNSKVMSVFGLNPPSWRDEVVDVLNKLVNKDGTVRDHA